MLRTIQLQVSLAYRRCNLSTQNFRCSRHCTVKHFLCFSKILAISRLKKIEAKNAVVTASGRTQG
jgi:hypothetical protein